MDTGDTPFSTQNGTQPGKAIEAKGEKLVKIQARISERSK